MRTLIEVVTAPTSAPISLGDLKAFLRVDSTADDALIPALLSSAVKDAERIMGRTISPQTKKFSFECSEADGTNTLMTNPVNSVTSVQLYDDNLEAFAAYTDYRVLPSNGYTKIDYGEAISPTEIGGFAIEVTATVGYAAIPADILVALKMHVAYLYENRGDVQSVGGLSIPKESKFIYRQNRILRVY